MPELPSVAMRVSDVPESLAFLVEKLGFTLTEHRPDADIAYLLADDGDPLLLAGPAAHDLTSSLSVQPQILKPGEGLDFTNRNLEAWATDLLSKGVTDFQIKQRSSKLTEFQICVSQGKSHRPFRIIDNQLFILPG